MRVCDRVIERINDWLHISHISCIKIVFFGVFWGGKRMNLFVLVLSTCLHLSLSKSHLRASHA